MSENETPIPENVIEALRIVRNSGRTNMFDRQTVAKLAIRFNVEAGQWLNKASDHDFIRALNEMGARLRD